MSSANATAREILAEALNLDTGALDAEAAIGITPEWDSLAHMRLVLGVEAALARTLSPMEIVSIATLADVAALID
jgi:acyl carrier protein